MSLINYTPLIKRELLVFSSSQIVNKMIDFNKRLSSRHAETEHRSLLELQVSSGGFSSNEEIGRLLTASELLVFSSSPLFMP